MERSQVNNNSNFITIDSIKYLEAQKTYETYLQNLIETYIYLSEITLSYLQRSSSSQLKRNTHLPPDGLCPVENASLDFNCW